MAPSKKSEEAKKKLESINQQMAQIHNSLTVDDIRELDEAAVEVRLEQVDRLEKRFNSLYMQFEDTDADDLLATLTNNYIEVKTKLTRQLHACRATAAHSSTSRFPSGEQPSFIVTPPKQRLPVLQIPKFSGDYAEWPDFFSMFNSVVHQDMDLTKIEKFQHLRLSLRDAALDTIRSLEINGDNYDKAIELLKSRFNNKRLNFQAHIRSIFQLNKADGGKISRLRELSDKVNAHLRALQTMGSMEQIADCLLIQLVAQKLDNKSLAKWEEETPSSEIPTWNLMAKFLEKRCQRLENVQTCFAVPDNQVKKASYNNSRKVLLAAAGSGCILCGSKDHNISKCERFIGLSPVVRYKEAKRLQLCLNCLRGGHSLKNCKASNCRFCASQHHSLLHQETNYNNNFSQPIASGNSIPQKPANTPVPCSSYGNSASALVSSEVQTSPTKDFVLLATAIIYVKNRAGSLIPCRALLDSASQLNFVTNRLVNQLQLKRRDSPQFISGIGQNDFVAKHMVDLDIHSSTCDYNAKLTAAIAATITDAQPSRSLKGIEWNIPKNLRLADPLFFEPQRIDMLIGASLFFDLLCVGQIRLADTLLTLQKTKLGWIASGATTYNSSKLSCLVAMDMPLEEDLDTNLNNLVERFWQIESFVDSAPKTTPEEDLCEDHFANNYKRLDSGEFSVRLPTKSIYFELGDSYNQAINRFKALEKKFQRNSELKQQYSSFIKEYSELNHMSFVHSLPREIPICFLPHHCVLKADSTTTKLRVVFDGSAPTSNGLSLNSILMKGPNIQPQLFDLLLRFRTFKIALTADICKMYRCVKMSQPDNFLQCIIWRDHPNEEFRIFSLDTVTYGTKPASFLAIRSMQQLARDEAHSYPIGAETIYKAFYVDDMIYGADSVEEAQIILNQTRKLLSLGNFHLRKWCSNNAQVLTEIAVDDRQEFLTFDDGTSITKALGLVWDPSMDIFIFSFSPFATPKKRNLRSFTIAKLYYKINEYLTAEQYLRSYLSVKEDNDQAHKLLGQCYQRLKKSDQALKAFQRSLHLNPKQPDVLADVCQLLLEDKNLNVNKAKYWCDLAESEKVQHDAVFSLRLKLLNKENLETNQVEGLIQKEISMRPNDVQLRVRLIRSYIEQNKVLDAFKYVYNLEMSMQDNFANNSEWYNIVWLVLNKYEQIPNTKKDWEFWLLLIICLERQVNISFTLTSGSATAGVTETANLLFNLDQYLFKATQLSDKLCVQHELFNLFLDHYRGQMLIHASALIFKRELLQNKNKWKETVKTLLPLLLLAYQTDVPDNREPWMKHSDEQGKHLIQLWSREGSFRCAQAGRTLLSCIADELATNKENANQQINHILGNNSPLWSNSDELLSQIRQICSDKQWRRNVFALLYCNSDQKVKEQSSLLIKSPKLNEPVFELPTYADIEHHEELAQYLKPQSLQHMVYLSLGNDNLSYLRAKYFSGLNFSTQNLTFCGAESLNQLDVDTFLYAATIQAKRALQVEREAFDNYNSGNRSACGRPRILPFVNLHGQLCTEEQSNWWLAAYQVYKNLSNENLAELRANLQFGIEAVRGVNGPKIDMIIVFKLGQIFVARSQDIVKPIEKSLLEARAENIYKYGLNMVKMNNKGVLEPFRKFFKFAKANSSVIEREISNAAEDAVSYLASRYFKKAEYEDLIDELAGIQLPFATYLQAEAYRKLDEANKTPKKAKRMYLDRASECLNQTLNLLKSTESTNPDHPLNSIIHTELKRLQQATMKFINEGSPVVGHNNSSTYEDAEGDFYNEYSLSATPAINRSRRETNAVAMMASPRNSEMESLVKQMANTLSLVKEELTCLKDKITGLEEAMKRTRITSNPPSRDDASHVLDDLYMIEDALQNQLYQPTPAQPHMSGSIFSNIPNGANGPAHAGIHSPYLASQQTQQQQQQATQQRNSMHMQPNNIAAAAAAAAAYNSPIFNPNYPMNYYTQPYMLPQPQGPPGSAGGMLGQRNPLPLQYMDANLNFSMASSTPLLPAPPQDGRTNNLYGLLTQPQQQPAAPPQLPQLSVAMSIASLTAPVVSNAPLNVPGVGALPPTILSQSTTSGVVATPGQFNKALNNQPVEKGPPANVVITNSDPLPNPNRSTSLAQQPTLSVTIPPHHIKPSIVATSEPNIQPPTQLISLQTTATTTNGSVSTGVGFTGFGLGSVTTSTASPFSVNFSSSFTTPVSSTTSIFSGSSVKSITSNPPSTTISTTTFSFKPQIEQAQAQAAAATENSSGDSIAVLNKTSDSFSSSGNKSGAEAEVEYDPRPDFKPIIPLPDEIEVRTGEEDEDIMFCCRAKLYRHADKDWKERGLGDIKILKNKDGYSRILMRREKIHKICANHKITKELILTTHPSEKKGLIWIANDFADEELRTERFLVRFKALDSAEKFRDAFIKAQKEAEELDIEQEKIGPKENVAKDKDTTQQQQSRPFCLTKGAISNFATSTPAAKTVSDKVPAVVPPLTTIMTTVANVLSSGGVSKTLFGGIGTTAAPTTTTTTGGNNKGDILKSTISPFANFSFDKNRAATTSVSTTTTTTASTFANIFSNLGKSAATETSPFSVGNLPAFQPSLAIGTAATSDASARATTLNKSGASDTEDEYVPTATFNPVIPLPDLVEVSTGEENEIVLFEHRAKLLRFDKEAGEWKDRGIGNIKLLQDKEDVNRVRLVMRREQIHKLCCNQRLYKNIVFKYAKNSQTALTWAGQDFSENELVTEMLTVRFKLPETCKQFHEAVLQAQGNMSDEADEENVKANREQMNENKDTNPKGFGDAFKPKAGSWDCSACYTRNAADKQKCVSCETNKDGTAPTKEYTNILLKNPQTSSFSFGVSPATTVGTNGPKLSTESSFNFGKPTATSSNLNTEKTIAADALPTTTKTGFGDQFKPKAGSWTCQGCYLSNSADDIYCKACNAPKDDTIPKKETTNDILALSNPAQKFNFGFNAAAAVTTAATTMTCINNSNNTVANSGFLFGAPTTIIPTDSGKSLFGNFTNAASTETSKTFTFPTDSSADNATGSNNPTLSKPSFSFSLQSKAMESPVMPASSGAGGESTTTFSLDKKDFNFQLKPKSPGKSGKSPIKFGGGGGDADVVADDGDENEYQEEENNTYFTPVIPLPEKIDVKTGEEDEEALYVHRAKLYRYIDGEWKERGIGDIKILRHKETKKLRIVMRRDQVLKICLNHVLNNEVLYKYKDDKSWLFVVNDFSEDSVKLEKFSLRFKTKEIAQGFMDAVKSALEGTSIGNNNDSNVRNTPSNLTKDVEEENILLKSTTANLSDADRATADKLQLPYEFFTEKPNCPGCRGCAPDDFIFPIINKEITLVNNEDNVNLLKPLELPSLSLPKTVNTNRSLLKQSALSPMTPSATEKTTEANIFSGSGGVISTVFGASADKTASDFSFTAAMNNDSETKTSGSSGGFLFGNSIVGGSGSIFGGGDQKPVFGQTPSIFGNSSSALSKSADTTSGDTDKPKSIFGNTMGVQFGAKPVFGSAGSSIFDSKSTTSATSIFPSTTNPNTNAQGGTSLFGGSTFTTIGNTQSSIFGGNNTTNKNFNKDDSSYTNVSQEQATVAPSFADLSNKAGVIDFASLAAKAKSESINKSEKKPGPGGFIGLTNQDAFSSFANSNPNVSMDGKANESTKSTDDDNENYDPHYEPIIPLPDEIQSSTGEEDETKLFGERANLYRYDSNTKEWKERGVGELKILQHKTKEKYRLVMRREQIYKLVLNHVIGPDFTFTNMNKNPKSFIWAAINYAESSDGVYEKLAVRFKKVEVANLFKEKLNECIQAKKQGEIAE